MCINTLKYSVFQGGNMGKKTKHIKKILQKVINDVAKEKKLHVLNPKSDFSRERKLTFSKTLSLVHTFSSQTLAEELLEYFGFNCGNIPTVSALIQQREKIKISAFKAIFERFTYNFYQNDNTSKDYRILAVDGTDINIAYNPNCSKTYIKPKDTRGFNQLHLTAFYDIRQKMYLDFVIQGKREHNEYSALCKMVDDSMLDEQTLLLADRGFESYNVLAHIAEKNWKFAIRAKDIDSNGICSALELPENEFDEIVDIILTRKQTKITKNDRKYKILPKKAIFDYITKENLFYPMKLRVVRFKITDDTYEVLITNLTKDEYSSEGLKKLYNSRWGIETGFRELKQTLGLEYFHSKKLLFIIQEIYAKMTLYNFCEVITLHVIIHQKSRKYTYQVNFSMAIKLCLKYFRMKMSETFDIEALISNYILPIRTGRSFKRRSSTAAKSFINRIAR